MRRGIVGALALASALGAGCQDPRKPVIERIDADREVMGRVSTAVNEVIRNAPDCDVAKPLLVEAYQRIEEARNRVRLVASKQTLDALKAQVDRVAQACP